MARTIIVDEIKKDEAATAMSVDGIAKAWANLNGTGTIATRDSLNVSSLTDNGTGDFTHNMTNAMLNADYSYVLLGGSPGTAWVSVSLNTSSGNGTEQAPTASSYRANTGYNTGSGSVTDAKYINTCVFGDLA
tara:strand:- start:1023 stop:1421 length:399 start_codon:yes stop_codon:yes gene_type:complete